MRTLTDRDVAEMALRKSRVPGKKKKDLDGFEYQEIKTFSSTPASLACLQMASLCHEGLMQFREQADRCGRYFKGEQWRDYVTVHDKYGFDQTMTEEEYIEKQGRPALKYNLIKPVVRNLVGQVRSNRYKSVVYSTKAGGQAAADQMSNALDDVKEVNDASERDAREALKFFITGSGIFYTGYSYDVRMKRSIPHFEGVDYHRYFQNLDATDVTGKDVNFCGDFIDVSVRELISLYAHNSRKMQNELLQIYGTHSQSQAASSYFYNAFTERDPNTDSLLGNTGNGTCRVIRVCRLEGRWMLYVHDWSDGTLETRKNTEENREFLKREKARRIAMAEQMGADYEETERLHLDWEEKYVQVWEYYHLSPWGHVLWQAECPYEHNDHPYVTIFYPMYQGQVYGLVYDLIDQQRMINRMVIMQDFIMGAAAKGVLLVPEDCIPDDMDLEDIAEEWAKYNGVIKIKVKPGATMPQQIVSRQINTGSYEMINLMMKFMTDVSGVQDAMYGKPPTAGTPASLYARQQSNSQLNTLDYMESLMWFFKQRDYKMIQIIQQFKRDPEYINAPGDHSEESRHYNPDEIRKYKFNNRIEQGIDTTVLRQYYQHILLNMLAQGQITGAQYAKTGVAMGSELEKQFAAMAESISNGQGITPEQIAGLQASIPQGTPEQQAAAQQILNGQAA